MPQGEVSQHYRCYEEISGCSECPGTMPQGARVRDDSDIITWFSGAHGGGEKRRVT